MKAWPNDPTFHPTFIQQLLDGIIYRGGQTIQHLLDENVLRLREHGNSLDHKQINKVLSIAMATSIKRRKVAAILAILQLFDEEDCKVKRKKTRKWVRRRKEKGFFANIVRELSIEDTSTYKEMLRMSHEDFLTILGLIERDISPYQVAGGHTVIEPKCRLTLTLRFLATGETFRSLALQFRISRAAISYIVTEVCWAITKNMQSMYLKTPSTADEWERISSKFNERWEFPNCLGAIDGKHVVMQPPPESGSQFFNYKHTHSLVLLAIAGPDNECLFADIGTNGRVSDGGVWNKSKIAQMIENKQIELPADRCLPFGSKKLPHVFIADDAFALKRYLMKPYPQNGLDDTKKIYNYRHSRARRIVENLFGIVANRWRVFRSIILLPPDTIEKLVLAALKLHNYLRQSHSRNMYCPLGFADSVVMDGSMVDGSVHRYPHQSHFSLYKVGSKGHNPTFVAKEVRDAFKEYFYNEGAVLWQWDKI